MLTSISSARTRTTFLSATCMALCALFGRASGQSLEAFQGDYVGNDGAFAGINGNGSASNASDPFTDLESFSGLDSMGNSQTMTLKATAYSSATYGSATAYGAGMVTNPYYNSANPAYFDGTTLNTNGSPDLLSSHGNAGWSDSLTFSGVTATDQVNFTFSLTGSGWGDFAAGLNFTTDSGGGTYDGFSTTTSSASWMTPTHALNAGGELAIGVDYYSGLTTYVSQKTEELDYSGGLLSTLTLTGIEVTNQAGQIQTGWSVSALSGASYPLATPEPASFAAVGIGVLGLLGRRNRYGRKCLFSISARIRSETSAK